MWGSSKFKIIQQNQYNHHAVVMQASAMDRQHSRGESYQVSNFQLWTKIFGKGSIKNYAIWAIPAETTILPSKNVPGILHILFLQILYFFT